MYWQNQPYSKIIPMYCSHPTDLCFHLSYEHLKWLWGNIMGYPTIMFPIFCQLLPTLQLRLTDMHFPRYLTTIIIQWKKEQYQEEMSLFCMLKILYTYVERGSAGCLDLHAATKELSYFPMLVEIQWSYDFLFLKLYLHFLNKNWAPYSSKTNWVTSSREINFQGIL